LYRSDKPVPQSTKKILPRKKSNATFPGKIKSQQKNPQKKKPYTKTGTTCSNKKKKKYPVTNCRSREKFRERLKKENPIIPSVFGWPP
jgi:hypothetical protein